VRKYRTWERGGDEELEQDGGIRLSGEQFRPIDVRACAVEAFKFWIIANWPVNGR